MSKSFLDVDLEGRVVRYANTATGTAALILALPAEAHVVVEATGPYGLRLCHSLALAGIAVSVINPAQSKHLAAATLARTKTDSQDARALSRLGQLLQPALWQPETALDAELRQLRSYLQLLMTQRTALTNSMAALACEYHPAASIASEQTQALAQLEAQIARLEQRMRALITAHWPEADALLQSIPGIGPKTATLLLAITRGYTRLQHPKQLLAYLGLCPKIEQSGTSHRSHLSKMGLASARRMLYVCAWSARRCNPACKALYERLRAKGKAHKLALCAVAAKLIRQACAVLHTHTFFIPPACT